VRPARLEDITAIVSLCEDKRRQYEAYQPVFHKKADDSAAFQQGYFRSLIAGGNAIVLVYLQEETVRGAVFGSLRSAPPVYAPGGKVCMVDDFVCRSEDEWPRVGQALLNAVTQAAKDKGAVLVNVVCGPQDAKKRKFLTALGYSVASEWHVKPIA
jgi:hypothetical protein